jgi:hypothetical protein
MSSSIRILIITVSVATVSCGDGRIHDDDWIVRSDLDTLTIRDLSDDWAGLDSMSRAGFLAEPDPAGAFIEARAWRMLLEETVRDLGYLEDPWIVSFERSWLRTESSIAMRRILEGREEASISGDDIAALTDRPGDRVWLSLVCAEAEAVDLGPFARFELPTDLARSVDSMAPGMVVESAEGLRVRLDSITTGTASIDAEGAAAIDGIAIPILVQGRLRFEQLAALAEMKGSGTVSIDTVTMDRLALMYADSSSLPAGPGVLMICEYGTWTADDVSREVAFFQTKLPFIPADRFRMGFVLDNILQQCCLEEMFRGEYPARYDSLRAEASDHAMGLAFDEMRSDSVLSRLEADPAADDRAAIEADSTDAWLDRLAGSRHLVLNEEAISMLPVDPGEWNHAAR